MPKIVREIERARDTLIQRLGACGVATIHEAQEQTGLMRAYMRPIYPQACVAGSAITVLCPPGDNLSIHAALEFCREGDVLVVAIADHTKAGPPEQDYGMFGDLLATACRAHGVAGLVIDAGVRDTTELTRMNFPVWSRTISAQGTVKTAIGSVNLPIVCAGAPVEAGDIVVADADGVVVVKRDAAAQVAEAGEKRRDKEQAIRARLESGELSLDIYGWRDKLAALGVEYE